MRTSLLMLLALVLTARRVPGAGDEHTVSRTLKVGELERTYLLHVPPDLPKEARPALVLAFHGGGGAAKSMEGMSGFSALSDREKFLVAYPEAVEKNWNDGRGMKKIPSQRDAVDDLGFVSALVDALVNEHRVDPKRVFATGISNGAIFSECLGARLSKKICAIACVAGGMAVPVAEDFHPEEPVSVLIMNGTEDPLVPYAGGEIAMGRGEVIGVEAIVKKWVAHNGCGEKPAETKLPDKDPEDGTRVLRRTWTGGKGGAEVVEIRIEHGGHTWPGGPQYLPERLIGKTCRDLDGSAVIWEFFAKHPRR